MHNPKLPLLVLGHNAKTAKQAVCDHVPGRENDLVTEHGYWTDVLFNLASACGGEKGGLPFYYASFEEDLDFPVRHDRIEALPFFKKADPIVELHFNAVSPEIAVAQRGEVLIHEAVSDHEFRDAHGLRTLHLMSDLWLKFRGVYKGCQIKKVPPRGRGFAFLDWARSRGKQACIYEPFFVHCPRIPSPEKMGYFLMSWLSLWDPC